jgi:PhzF family phenazine biosynthesis protein
MQKLIVKQIDSFTDKIFGGNPAGVVMNADGLTADQMANIARELNLSETAFVLKPEDQSVDLSLRFFTSGKNEVKFCGHATVAAMYALAKAGQFGVINTVKNVRVATGVGMLSIDVHAGGKDFEISIAAPQLALAKYKDQGESFASRLGIAPEVLHADAQITHDSELNYLYIPASSSEVLTSLAFNFGQVKKNFADEGIVVFCLYSQAVQELNADLHTRGLAPLVGIDEDPVTGSMQAGLVASARLNSLVEEKTTYTIVQGGEVGRPGFVRVEVEGDNYRVLGSAVEVFSTEITL